MEQKQLQQSNIDNLTNLWRLMGIRKFPLSNSLSVNQSTGWPYRLWVDYGATPTREESELLQRTIADADDSTIFSVLNDKNSQLTALAEQSGLEVYFQQTVMDLPANAKIDDLPGELTFEKVDTEEQISIWTKIASLSFGYDIPVSFFQKLLKNPKINIQLGYLAGTPVATGLLFENSDVVGIHLVGIHPDYRRRGFAGNMMRHLINIAQKLDLVCITLQASAMGKPLYEAMGFKERFLMTHYRKV